MSSWSSWMQACRRGASHAMFALGAVVLLAGWGEQAEISASDEAAADQFGWSAAVSGDTAIVGAPDHEAAGLRPGGAYVFVQTGTTWTLETELTADGLDAGEAYPKFGWSVSVSGDTAIVGAPANTTSPNGVGTGAAYVFVRSGTTWTQVAELSASDEATGDDFGSSVAVDGGTVIVGSPNHHAGAAYVFVQSGTTWVQ
jgi:FG-GAP repeat